MYAKCSKCGSDKTHSSRVRPGERTAATLFMKPMRCRQCKERFWVQNRGAYLAAAAITGGVALFLGLIWLVVMHATHSQDVLLSAPGASAVPGLRVPGVRADADADLKAAEADAPQTINSGAAAPGGAAAAQAQSSPGLKSPDDRAITVQWYRENADKGDLDAQYKLGLLHLTGKGALQDFGEAAKWLKLSAEQGHPQAQYHLGLIYRVGHGVQTDQGQAYKWLNLAAAAGVSQAVLVRNEVMRSLSADQLSQAQKASREWQATRPKPNQVGEQTPKASDTSVSKSAPGAEASGPAQSAESHAPQIKAKAALSGNDPAPASVTGTAPTSSKN
jgi:uncharacterized protein